MAKVIPIEKESAPPTSFSDLTDLIKQAIYPRFIKIESNLLPDLLIEINPYARQESSSWKFLKKILRPRVYVLTQGGYAFGYDLSTGKMFKVTNPKVFTKGALQSFLSNPIGLFTTGLLIGLAGYIFIRGIKSIREE
jgi:hypothetical protein